MKKRRLLAGALCLALTLTTALTPVFATGFSDVDEDPTVSWAKDSIQQMTNSGYIKGYEDGTFKPYRSISRIECLLLMARMLGAEESDYADIAADAREMYSDTVQKYNTTYINELCYLLYNGIVTETDLATYASETNANSELLRYQAAILMSKLLGAASEAKNFTVEAATYPDDSQIPSSAKAYVEYVTANGIMNGMKSDDGTTTTFSPNTSLTRAQMATLLSRMQDKIAKMTYVGTIASMDLDENTITIDRGGSESARKICEDTVFYQEGEEIDAEDLIVGSEIGATEIHGHIQLMYVITPGKTIDESLNKTIYAKIHMLTQASGNNKVVLADPEDSSITTTYLVTEDCTFTINGTKATYADLEKKDFVKAVVNEDKLLSIAVVDDDFVVNGTLQALEFDDDNNVYVTIIDRDEDEQRYAVSVNGAIVSRDGETVEYRALSIGDTVKLTLSNGKINRITATSNTVAFKGTIKEIHITATPYLTLNIDGKTEDYPLHSDATIMIAGVESTIYGLRRNIAVSGTLDGNEIKSLSAASVTTTISGELSGTIVGVNTNYKALNIEDNEGGVQTIYYTANTKFLTSTGESITAKTLEKGATVSITGAEKNGFFEATIVIVK